MLGVGAFIIVVGILVSWNRIFPPTQPVPLITNPNDLPGIQTTTAPWSPEITHLRARLNDIGFPALAQEGLAFHIHQHIDISINGNTVTVPAGIGINQIGGFISPVHTHDTSGIIHVESNVTRDYTLGEFFDVWGVRFTASCIGGYCANATNTLRVYSNGAPVTGDPRSLVLTSHQEIMVVYGSASSTPNIISSYAFPLGD
ncbi:MAG TPA: hypothetical protein PK539_01480 [Candidatus Paceibacterota bacterium]|nr:hypothetical protein [Candidatus Paceibacterota bacterium]